MFNFSAIQRIKFLVVDKPTGLIKKTPIANIRQLQQTV